MRKTLLSAFFLIISLVSWSYAQDTLRVTSKQFTNITLADRFAPDSVNFTRIGDTLIIEENKWRGYRLKLIAVRSFKSDSMFVALFDTARAGLPANGRFLTTVKVPEAFKTSDNVKLKFEGKSYDITLIVTGLSNNHENENGFKMYPNPVKERLFLEPSNEISSVSIYNLSGERMAEVNPFKNGIDISNLNPGAYYLSSRTSKGELKRSFIKE